MKDAYKTIDEPSKETLFKDRNSKFFGYAFPVLNEEDVKESLEIKKETSYGASFLLCLAVWYRSYSFQSKR